MKNKLPEAEWYFATSEDHLSLIDQVRIIVWANGLCLGGYEEENRAIAGKVFLWTNDWNTDRMIQIFENEPLVAGPQPITEIWLSSEQQLLIPPHLFDTEKAASWLQKVHFIESDYSILENQVAAEQDSLPRAVYAVPDEVIYRLDRFFPEAKTDILTSALVPAVLQLEEDQMILSFLNQTVQVVWVKDSLLKYAQPLKYESSEDIIYHLAELCDQFGCRLQDIKVRFYGIVPTPVSRELPSYLNPSIALDQETLLFDLLNQISSCAS